MCPIYGFYYDYVVCSDWEVPDFIFSTEYFRVCVDVHPKSCWSVLALSDLLICFLWKHDLLLSTFLRKV